MHIIVYKNGETFHCRKESAATIGKLLNGELQSVGKAAIVLKREEQHIALYYKNELLGKVKFEVFREAIRMLRNAELEISN